MDLTFQVPMQYCSLNHQTLFLSPVTSTTGYFCFGSVSSSILATYRHGEFIFQYPIFLPFHTVHGVLKARILKLFAIPFSSGPHSVIPLHHDPAILGCSSWHGLVSLSRQSCRQCDQIDLFSLIMVSVCLPSADMQMTPPLC